MSYKYPKLTVDGVIFKDKKILLVKRKNPPFKGKWALPGGFVEYGEKVEDAVVREIEEETSLKTSIIEIVGIYSDPDRDPRGHTVTIVYLLQISSGVLHFSDDADDAKFFDVNELPELAFDHSDIVKDALRKVR